MSEYLDRTSLFLKEQVGNCWSWVNGLNTEEWFVLLGITATLGFLCMRGMTSHKGI